MIASNSLYSVLFVWVYTRGVEARPWIGQGIRYGFLAALFTLIPAALNDCVVYDLPRSLVANWVVAGVITLVSTGFVTAEIFRTRA